MFFRVLECAAELERHLGAVVDDDVELNHLDELISTIGRCNEVAKALRVRRNRICVQLEVV